jgi:hypothetical protein
VRPGLVAAAELFQRLPQTEMPVRGRRVDRQQLLERLRGPRVLSAVVVSPPERLDDRPLVRLQACGALEDDGGLRVVPPSQQGVAALKQAVGRLALGQERELGALVGLGIAAAIRIFAVGIGPVGLGTLGWLAHARYRATTADGGSRDGSRQLRQASRSTGSRRGLGVVPGIRPRLAMGRPSISFRSPVKSIGLALLM